MTGRGNLFPGQHEGVEQTVFYASRLVSLAILAVLCRPMAARLKAVSLASAAAIVAGALVRVVAFQSADALSQAMVLVGQALCGLGYMPCLFALLLALTRLFPYPATLPVVLVALVGKQQLPALFYAAPEATHVWLLMILLAALVAALLWFWRLCGPMPADGEPPRPVGDAAAGSPPQLGQTRAQSWHVMLLGCLADLSMYLFGVASGIGLVGSAASTATNGTIMTLSGKALALAVLVALGVATILRRGNAPLDRRFVPAFVALAFATTLTTFALAFGDSPEASHAVAACLLGVYDFNQLLEWALVLCVLGLRRDPVALRYAAGIVVSYDMLACMLRGLPAAGLPEQYGTSLMVSWGLIVIVVSAVALPAWMARRAEGVDEKEALPDQASLPDTEKARDDGAASKNAAASLHDALQTSCVALARAYGLTARETEVLELICQGRGRKAIGDELCMSEGTVKTHVAHIYEKTGVNTREALTELAFGAGTDRIG